MLHNMAPDVFVKGYARACQKGKQPIIKSPQFSTIMDISTICN